MARKNIRGKTPTRSAAKAAPARKKAGKKAAVRATARVTTRTVKRSASQPTRTKKPVTAARRSPWLDDEARTPIIDRYARQLGSFLEAMADGVVDAAELKRQETRLVKLMKEVEPQLDDALHARVTRLLCELTAYDIMQITHSLYEARPKTIFQG
jgi:hypothetical protein